MKAPDPADEREPIEFEVRRHPSRPELMVGLYTKTEHEPFFIVGLSLLQAARLAGQLEKMTRPVPRGADA